MKLAYERGDTTAYFVDQLLGRRSIAEGYLAGELCVALNLRIRSRDPAFDSGDFFAIYERGIEGRVFDVGDFVVLRDWRGDWESAQRHVVHMDDAVLVDVGKPLQDGQRVPLCPFTVPSLVWLKPAQGRDVRRVEHLDDGMAVEVAAGQSDRAGDRFRLLLRGFPLKGEDRKLPDEVVESGVEVVENVPDPATPLEDRDFFAHFNVEDVAGGFSVRLTPDSQGAGVLEGFDFLVKCLGMSIGLTELGVAAIERIHRAGS